MKVRCARMLSITVSLLAVAAWCVTDRVEKTAAGAGGGEGGKGDAAAEVKMSPVEEELLTVTAADAKDSPAGTLAHVPPATPAGPTYRVLEIEFQDERSCEQFKPPEGVSAFQRFGRFMDAFVDAAKPAAVTALQKAREVRWIDVGQVVAVPPPPKPVEPPEKARGVSERTVVGGLDGLTGKGVIVAVLDTGVDFRHKDFITVGPDGQPTSRLLYFWDTTTAPAAGKPGGRAPLAYPNGESIGTLYSRDELTAELRNPQGIIPVPDREGHGTACAGIAAGNGASTPGKDHAGVAPGADLIAVRLGTGPGIENAYLLNAVCSWLDRVAGDRPLVVSCSFGGQYGGHDGERVAERQLDAQFPLGKKGRAICIAAGNEAEVLEHARVDLREGRTRGSLAWAPKTVAILRLYVDTDRPDDLVLDLTGYNNPNLAIKRYVQPLSGSVVFEVVLPLSPAPRAELEIASKSGKPLEVDAYFQTVVPGAPLAFAGSEASKTCLIASPGACANAVTVGSYDFNDVFEKEGIRIHLADKKGQPLTLGALSSYSDRGYLRGRDVIKPDVVAPGQYAVAPAPTNRSRYDPGLPCGYRAFNGTSAATPYAAGVVALLMERKPDLTAGEIKELLRRCATADDFTGKTPNPDWGYGKLNYACVQKMVEAAGHQ